MRFDGVIFDLDGTLLDTISDLTDSVNAALAALSLNQLSEAEVMARVGNGFKVLLERSIPDDVRSEESVRIAYDAFVAKYEQCFADKTVPYEGIAEVVSTLKENGIKLTVNTNKRADYAGKLISMNFGDDTFLEVLGEGMGYEKKPVPDGALHLVEVMGVSLERTVYIGDSQTDIKTAKNAGLKVIGVSWGFRDRQVLLDCEADFIADSPKDIADIVLFK